MVRVWILQSSILSVPPLVAKNIIGNIIFDKIIQIYNKNQCPYIMFIEAILYTQQLYSTDFAESLEIVFRDIRIV